LLEQLEKICPAVTSQSMDFGDFPLRGSELVMDGIALGYGPRRARLDELLVRAAVDAGAELREGFVVEDFLSDSGRVSGVRGREYDAARSVIERARVTVGADGRHSRLARYVRAPAYECHGPLTFWYFSYWSDVPPDGLEIHIRNGCALLCFS
jgi:flavin-dependent dehydrogenase